MIDKVKLDDAEKLFRSHADNRNELRQVLEHPSFRNAVELLKAKRRFEESMIESASLAGAEVISIRLHSQRIGAESFLDDLWALTDPWVEPNPDLQPDYGTDKQ